MKEWRIGIGYFSLVHSRDPAFSFDLGPQKNIVLRRKLVAELSHMNFEPRIGAAIKGITKDTGEFFHEKTIMKGIASPPSYIGDRASHEKPNLSKRGRYCSARSIFITKSP